MIMKNVINLYVCSGLEKLIDRAIKNNTSCHFWFHPSFSNQFLTKIMPEVFKYIDERRSDIWVTTMGEYTTWLNENQK